MSTTIWSLLGSLLLYGQRFLVYPHGFVEDPRVLDPSKFNIPFDDLRLPTPDNVTLACHLMQFSDFYANFSSYTKSDLSCDVTSSSAHGRRTGSSTLHGHGHSRSDASQTGKEPEGVRGRATVVMFHGNAMNHGDMIDCAVQFLIMGCNVLTVSYRGYGHSTGKPSEKGLRTDAQTALNYLSSHPALSQTPVIIYGQSLGGAVAIDLTSRNANHPLLRALILENTFTSIPSLVRSWPRPIGALSFLCTQRWPSLTRIRKIPDGIPILMLSGDKDGVVPPRHMGALWAAARARGLNKAEADGGEGRCSPFFFCTANTAGGEERQDEGKMTPEEMEQAVKEEMETLESPATIRSGHDMFRLFKGTGHENTYLAPSYWSDIRTFIDTLELAPPVNDQDFDDIFTSTFSQGSIFYRR